MYVCVKCRELFDEPQSYLGERLECHGYWTEKYSGCPNCTGYYVEAKLCSYCGEYITTQRLYQLDEEYYCDDCIEERYIYQI